WTPAGDTGVGKHSACVRAGNCCEEGLSGCPAAVGDEDFTVYEACFITGEEQRDGRQFFRLRHAYRHAECRLQAFVSERAWIAHLNVGCDTTWADHVTADALLCVLVGDAAGQADHG